MSFHRLVMSAALAGAVGCVAPPSAAAREPVPVPVAAVVVESVDVEQVPALGAGVALNFTVFGTPGAAVVVRIDGGRRVFALNESEAGVYEGSYVIDGIDAIRPESRVTATLQKNGAVAHAALDEPLLLAQGTAPWDAAAAPVDVRAAPVAPMTAGTPVPPASAEAVPVPIAVAPTQLMPIAVAPTQPLPITVAPGQPVPIVASRGQPVPIVVAPAQPAPRAAVAATPSAPAPAPCGDCAVVESIRAVETAPRGGVIGTIGGAIAGAILGKELGEAHNRRVLSVLGAIGGAFAGRQIERRATSSTQYDVDLRLADGSVLKRRYEQAPPFAAGATIRLGPSSRGTPASTF